MQNQQKPNKPKILPFDQFSLQLKLLNCTPEFKDTIIHLLETNHKINDVLLHNQQLVDQQQVLIVAIMSLMQNNNVTESIIDVDGLTKELSKKEIELEALTDFKGEASGKVKIKISDLQTNVQGEGTTNN